MEHYTIRQVKLLVRHEDGTEEWLAAALHDDCRTVIIGLDACRTAGTYYRAEAHGLAPVARDGSPRVLREPSDVPAVDIDFDEEPSPVATRALPDVLEYRQGKWYIV